jgi:hypothetical protein
MSKHFLMGAINKTTSNYEYPQIACKMNKYICPYCNNDVIFRKGKIKQPHFAHKKSTNPCGYYTKPGESQIHKDGKLLMKTLLDNRRCINLYRICESCSYNKKNVFNIRSEEYTDNMSAEKEFKFVFNESKKSADVALLENKEIKYIFEIHYTNKTLDENRPEPWFEIKAETLIHDTNTCKNVNEKGEITIECIRHYKCVSCKYREDEREKRLFKDREQQLERKELLLMGKDDIRTLEIERRVEIERRQFWDKQFEKWKKEGETQRMEMEKQRKIEMEKQRIEMEKQTKKREQDEIKKGKEIWKHATYNNETCPNCNINHCKCLNSKLKTNEYGLMTCSYCSKRRCKCIKITNFFKK